MKVTFITSLLLLLLFQSFKVSYGQCQVENCTFCPSPSTCSKCEDGFYVYYNYTCEKCYFSCQTCENSSIGCLTCIQDYYLFESNCYSQEEFYGSSCYDAYCINCSLADLYTCIQCCDDYILLNGSCAVCENNTQKCKVCNPGFFVNNFACYACSTDCKTCQGQSVNCTSCSTGKVLNLGSCEDIIKYEETKSSLSIVIYLVVIIPISMALIGAVLRCFCYKKKTVCNSSLAQQQSVQDLPQVIYQQPLSDLYQRHYNQPDKLSDPPVEYNYPDAIQNQNHYSAQQGQEFKKINFNLNKQLPDINPNNEINIKMYQNQEPIAYLPPNEAEANVKQ